MLDGVWPGIFGTMSLWGVSATLALLLGLVLAAGSRSPHFLVRCCSRAAINGSRCVPTSIIVIAAGIGALRVAAPEMPVIFPDTPDIFQ